MRFKIKIGLIALGIIVLLGGIGGIYVLLSKKNTTTSRHQTPLPKLKENLPKKLEPKVVWEKEFDSEIINFVVPKIPGMRKADEFPIVAVETEKDLLFLNKKGEVSRKIPAVGRMAIFSQNGKYILLSGKQEGFEFVWDIKSWKYLTYEGRELWEIEDVYGCPDISPDGERIVICRPDDGVWFYNKSGEVMRKYEGIRFASGSEWSSFSVDGKYYAFSFYPQSDNKSEYSVILFDRKGEILWTKKFNDYIEDLFLFHHGEAIFIGCGDYLYLFKRDGQLVRKQNWGYISPKRDFIVDFIVKGRKHPFVLIDSFSGKKVSSFTLEDKNASSIEVVSISPNTRVFSLWIEKPDKNEMYLVSKEGEMILQKKFKKDISVTDYFKREINNVTIEFLSDNKCLIIIKEIKKLLLYELTF